MCVMQTPARWNMVSQTRHPCSASCNLITVASDEATFPAKERGLSCLMRPWPTSVFAGPDPSVTGCHLPDPTLSCAGGRGEGRGLATRDSLCYRDKEPLNLFLFPSYTSFSSRRSQKCLSDLTSILFLCSRCCFAHWMCVSPGHCLKRGLDLFWSRPYRPAVYWPRSQIRCSTEMTPGGKG